MPASSISTLQAADETGTSSQPLVLRKCTPLGGFLIPVERVDEEIRERVEEERGGVGSHVGLTSQ